MEPRILQQNVLAINIILVTKKLIRQNDFYKKLKNANKMLSFILTLQNKKRNEK